MLNSKITSGVSCLLACAGLIAGCGSSGGGGASTDVTARPAPSKTDFPSAAGKTLGEVLDSTDGPAIVAVSPASEVFYTGENRYSFGVFHFDRTQIPDAQVALYFAKVPPDEAAAATGGAAGKGKGKPDSGAAVAPPPETTKAQALDQPAQGPFPAAVESLVTKPAFQAKTTVSDPDAATAVYTTHFNFPSEGEWRIAAVIRDGSKLTATLLPSAIVGQFKGVPRVGQRPPRIHTPTPKDVGGDLAKITTRIPPEAENQVDFHDALGKDPIVLLFSTPQFCQSRVCGPVLDVAEQVREGSPADLKFIHMEIYNDNDPGKGVRPQVRAFNLPSEPWLFVIDRKGVVRTVIEGAFSVDELQKAVAQVDG